MARTVQHIVLYERNTTGPLFGKVDDNLDPINKMLEEGWRVVSISPTSSGLVGVFALLVLEREVPDA